MPGAAPVLAEGLALTLAELFGLLVLEADESVAVEVAEEAPALALLALLALLEPLALVALLALLAPLALLGLVAPTGAKTPPAMAGGLPIAAALAEPSL